MDPHGCFSFSFCPFILFTDGLYRYPGGEILVENFLLLYWILPVPVYFRGRVHTVYYPPSSSGCINLIPSRLETGWARIWPTKSTPRRTSLFSRRKRPQSVVASQISWVSYSETTKNNIIDTYGTFFKNMESTNMLIFFLMSLGYFNRRNEGLIQYYYLTHLRVIKWTNFIP